MFNAKIHDAWKACKKNLLDFTYVISNPKRAKAQICAAQARIDAGESSQYDKNIVGEYQWLKDFVKFIPFTLAFAPATFVVQSAYLGEALRADPYRPVASTRKHRTAKIAPIYNF